MAKTKRDIDLRTVLIAPLLLLNQDLLYRVLAQVLEASAAFIENLNRAQLFAGTDSTGAGITPDYTEATVQEKAEKGQPTDRVTLRDTGAFYESIFTEVFANAFDLNADDPKTSDLKQKYGVAILGLTDENKTKLIAYILPTYVRLLRAELGLR